MTVKYLVFVGILVLGLKQAEAAPKDSSPICKYCLSVINIGSDLIYKDGHLLELTKQFLNATCHSGNKKKPLGIDCDNVEKNVDDYAKAILKGNDTAEIACSALGACKQEELVIARALKTSHLPSSSAQFLFNEVLSVLEDKSDERGCTLCTKIMDDIITVFIKPLSEESFLKELQNTCLSVLPFSLDSCTKIVQRFGHSTYTFLKEQKDGKSACTKFNACPTKTFTKLTGNSANYTQKCKECFNLSNAFVNQYVRKFSVDEFVKKLDQYCYLAKKYDEYKHCKNLATTYGRHLHKVMLKDEGPKKICELTDQCDVTETPLLGELSCSDCQMVTESWVSKLTNYTLDQFISMGKSLCDRMKINDGETPNCVHLVDEFGPIMQTTLMKLNVPSVLCKAVEKCPKSSEKVERFQSFLQSAELRSNMESGFTFLYFKSSNSKKLSDEKNEQCDMCHKVQNYLKDANLTENALGYLTKLCKVIPVGSKHCEDWVEENRAEILKNATEFIQSDKMCKEYCTKMTLKHDSDDDDYDDDKYNHDEDDDKYNHDEDDDDDDDIDSMVLLSKTISSAYLNLNQFVRESDAKKCDRCHRVQEFLIDYSSDSVEVVKTLCSIVPLVGDDCRQWIEDNKGSIFNKTQEYIKSGKMCQSYCEPEIQNMVNSVRLEKGNRVNKNQESGSLTSNSLQAKDKTACEQCHKFQEYISKSNYTEQSINMLKNICSYVPLVGKNCSRWIDDHRAELLRNASNIINSEEFCKDYCKDSVNSQVFSFLDHISRSDHHDDDRDDDRDHDHDHDSDHDDDHDQDHDNGWTTTMRPTTKTYPWTTAPWPHTTTRSHLQSHPTRRAALKAEASTKMPFPWTTPDWTTAYPSIHIPDIPSYPPKTPDSLTPDQLVQLAQLQEWLQLLRKSE